MKKFIPIVFVFVFLFAADVFSQTVYITKYGKKYHKYECRYTKNSCIEIELSEAVSRELKSCKVCKPGGGDIDSVQYVQCRALTKKGTQCKRQTKDPNGLCWQHQDE